MSSRIVSQICAGLHFAHQQGVVHRDIKPGNIRILDDGTVKILDFGIAKVAGSTLTTGTGLLGTAAYMSPEQLRGGEVGGDLTEARKAATELVTDYSSQTDTASFGRVVLYRLYLRPARRLPPLPLVRSRG